LDRFALFTPASLFFSILDLAVVFLYEQKLLIYLQQDLREKSPLATPCFNAASFIRQLQVVSVLARISTSE
jgi:hypothetical protein